MQKHENKNATKISCYHYDAAIVVSLVIDQMGVLLGTVGAANATRMPP